LSLDLLATQLILLGHLGSHRLSLNWGCGLNFLGSDCRDWNFVRLLDLDVSKGSLNDRLMRLILFLLDQFLSELH
jgi:hypothetical protein